MSDWQGWATLAAVGFGAYVVVLWITALAWVYRDIRARTSDQTVQALSVILVFVFNLPGLLLYLILRPKETLLDTYERQLEAEALLREINDQAACPTCRRKISDEFVVCPYCRATLRLACESCGRSLIQTWVVCPYCGRERTHAQPRALHASVAVAPAQTLGGATDAKSQVMSPARPRPPGSAPYTPPAPQRPASPPADSAADASS